MDFTTRLHATNIFCTGRHQFFELFEVLGMDRQVNVCNFVRVLALVKIDVNNDRLHVNELHDINSKLSCNCLLTKEDKIFGCKCLGSVFNSHANEPIRHTPSFSSLATYYSDNADFEEKIGNDIGMPYVARLEKLGVCLIGSFAWELKTLPKHLQPNILSVLSHHFL
jgi:hypothetical protein